MYYAKSKRADGSQPTVAEHLDAVSAQAAEYGREIGAEEQARIAGLVHDLGKCGERFQQVLRQENQHIDNLAQSVVIFDEAQSLPTHLTSTTLQAVNELCRQYQMTMATIVRLSAMTDSDYEELELYPDFDE